MPLKVILAGAVLRFPYKNYRGEISNRHAQLLGLDWGENEYYPEPQWLMRCWDFDKRAMRSFALANIDPEQLEVDSVEHVIHVVTQEQR